MYNMYPKDIKEIKSEKEWKDFFMYPIESMCFREAYPTYDDIGKIIPEKLKIFWIKEKLNLGYAIGTKDYEHVKFYAIGNPNDWDSFHVKVAKTFLGDNS